MHKGLHIFVALIVIASVLVAYLDEVSVPPTYSTYSGSGSGGHTIGDEDRGNFSLGQIKQLSTIIVTGTVTQRYTTYGTLPNVSNDTVFTVSVSSFLKGGGPTLIQVTDSGSAPDDPSAATLGDAVLAVTQSYVLFLSSDWTCPPSPPYAPCILPPTPLNNTFHIVGGVEGKFLLSNGLVYSYSALYPAADQGVGIMVNGVSIDSFANEVANS